MKLLDWATIGTPLLVGVTDPIDRTFEPRIVEGELVTGCNGRPAVSFTLDQKAGPEEADAVLLGDTWASTRTMRSGTQLALTVFTPDSEGHLRWLMADTQRRVHQLLALGLITDPQVSSELQALTDTLHRLVCQFTLLSWPHATTRAA